MNRRFGLLAVLIAFVASILVVTSTGTANAQKAIEAQSLNELQATDEELTQGIAKLDAEVVAQQALVASAQQALDSANQAVTNHERDIAGTEVRIDELTAVAAKRAVQAYQNPQEDTVSFMLSSERFEDASRRSEILNGVAGRDASTISDLKAAKKDLQRQQAAAVKARQVATERRAAEQAKLDELNKVRAEQQRLHKGLEDRLATYAAEDEAGAVETSLATGGQASRGGAPANDNSRVSAAGMQWPVRGTVRSPFGPRWGRLHAGIDIGAAEGTPMYAAKGGTVKKAGYDGGGYGNLVTIDHGGGLITFYGHMSRIGVRSGQTVATGEYIGNIGHTGRVVPPTAAAAHVHFETRVNGSPRNPMNYLP